MSYCRWSSDWFRCDLYCYESDSGFITNVAARRHRATDNLPPEFDETDAEDREDFFVLHQKLHDLMAANRGPDNYRDLGLPHDGEDFVDATEREMYARILELERLGYHIPKYLHDDAVTALATPTPESP